MDSNALIQEFVSLTNSDEATAATFLARGNYDMMEAIELYFSETESAGAPPQQSSAAVPSSVPAPSATGRTSNIATFASTRDEDDEVKGKRQDFYAGGHNSGIAVQGPPENASDIRKQFLDLAKQAGAIDHDQYQREEKAQQATASHFAGQGFRLGDEETPSAAVGTPLASQPQTSTKKHIKITFWKNGFSIDDGENDVKLQAMQDPANRRFLAAIQMGRVPPELMKYGRDIDVEIEDKHDHDFEKPKRQVKAFVGQGHRLGAPTTTVHPSTLQPISQAVSQSSQLPIIKPDQPQTKLQIKLADGTKLVANFNYSSTIADVMLFVRASRPGQGDFILMTTYPKRDLTEIKQTLEQANLLKGVVVQRML